MPLCECCLLFSHHCPDVLFYSIQVDSEHYGRKENANIPASLDISHKERAISSHRPQSILFSF